VAEQAKLLNEFSDRLKSHGLVFLGEHEDLSENEWRSTAKQPVSAFMKKA
jgi:purine-binding chemotaxis protein CheW